MVYCESFLQPMIKNLTKLQKEYRKRILEISYKHKLSHLGSCLSVVDLIAGVYKIKKKEEIFILSAGHGAIALYVVLEKYNLSNAEKLFKKHGVHPNRNKKANIDCSSGSLGHGLPIALGMALADKNKDVYCLISDGECAEGSVWESFRIASDLKVNNLKIILNANGWGAYGKILLNPLMTRIKSFNLALSIIDGHNLNQITTALKKKGGIKPLVVFARTNVAQLPFLKGQDAHYHIMNYEDYLLAVKLFQ